MRDSMVSIIIPVYKAERYLSKCLDSIVSQTHRKIEIILVDDGSPDKSGAICDEYAEKDGRIVVIHKENGGVSSARNAGLQVARGEWIGFVDADDWVEPDMYEYMIGLGQKYGAAIVQCGLFVDEKDDSQLLFGGWEEDLFFSGVECMELCDVECFGNSSCNKLFRAGALKWRFYDPECPMGEDLLFNLQVLQTVKGVVLGTEAKYHYVQHEESACHAPPNYRFIHSHREVLKRAAQVFEKGSPSYDFFKLERLRMDMHNCSRLVRSPELKLDDLKNEIRADLRKESFEILKSPEIALKEKTKLMLIAWAWGLYRRLLLASKKTKRQ